MVACFRWTGLISRLPNSRSVATKRSAAVTPIGFGPKPMSMRSMIRPTVERVTRQILLDGRATDELTGASDTICVAAFTSGMGPLLGYWAARGLFQAPNDVLEVLELHYRHNTMRMANLAKRATQAVECLAGRGVRATV